MTRAQLRLAARRILRAGLKGVEPARLVRAHLRAGVNGIRAGGILVETPARVLVVAVGKASVPMARAAHRILGRRLSAAIVIAPGAAPAMARTTSFVSGHPIPDASGFRAAKHVIRLLEDAQENDLVLLLLSGGASAMMPAPVAGVSLRDKQAVTRLLLARGASIAEINAVRKRLSRLKGGGFIRLAAPARVITLALSDVPGDDIGTIGSGPTVIDSRDRSRALRAVRRFLTKADISDGVRQALLAIPQAGKVNSGKVVVIGSGRTFADAAATKARELGFRAHVQPDTLRGEARRCGPALVRASERVGASVASCLIATGETVVRVRGDGEGGRNQEVALSAAPAIARLEGPCVLAAFATDGRDGPGEASGAMVDHTTAKRAREMGLSIASVLDRNDSGTALRLLGDQLATGTTGTNVADIAVILR